MKFLIDFFPVLLFFIAYKMYDIYVATVVSIVAAFIQVGYSYFKYKRVENMHLITLVLLVVFGGLTLFLQDEAFIKWKPTVINMLFAVAFLGSQFIGEKSFIERMLGASITLPKAIWNKLNTTWALFFAALGILNLYVVYNYSTDTWVNFKLFGMTGLTFAFVLAQGIYLTRHIKMNETETQSEES